MIGTEMAPPSPCGASQTTKTPFVKTISGEIERSKPPPMIDGALASAAIASGATLASWSVDAEAAVHRWRCSRSAAPMARTSREAEAVGADRPLHG